MNTGLTIIKNTGVLFLGRFITIVLGIVYVSALSRYAQPSGLGMIATATALVSLANLLLNFGLDDLTVRDVAVDKSRAAVYIPNLFFLRGVLVIIFLVVILAITCWVDYPPVTLAIILIYCLAYVFDELTSICFSIFNAHERMEFSAALQTGRDLLNILLSLLAITLQSSLYMIVGISAFASFMKLIAGLAVLKWKFGLRDFRIDLGLSRRLMKSSLPFAALLLISVLTQSSGTFILSLFRPAQEVGLYSSAGLLVGYLLLIPTMFIHAIFPVFSRLNDSSRDQLKIVYSIAFKYLLILGFALCFGTIVTAGPVVSFLYGPDYEQAAQILQVLAFVFFWILGFANGSLLNATGGQKISTKFGAAGITLMIGASLVLIPRWGSLGAALARILPGAFFFIPLTIICHKRLGLVPPYALMIKSLVAALVMAGTASFALTNHLPLLLILLVLAPAVYAMALLTLGVLGCSDYQMVVRLLRERGSKDPPDAHISVEQAREM